MATQAEIALRYSTSDADAVKYARKLVSGWAHLNAHDPLGYAASLSAVLAKYPLGVVEQCCDPAQGLALEREFPPNPKSIADWCDLRVKQHQGAIIWGKQEAAAKREERIFTDEHRESMLQRWSNLLHRLIDKQPQHQEAAE